MVTEERVRNFIGDDDIEHNFDETPDEETSQRIIRKLKSIFEGFTSLPNELYDEHKQLITLGPQVPL